MIRSVLVLVLVLVPLGSSKPTERRTRVQQNRVHEGHEDPQNFHRDHEAFLGPEEAQTFDLLPPQESRRRLSIIVDKMDKNKDGFISEEELKAWIRSAQRRYIHESVKHQWKDFDLNDDGLISWAEYRNVTYGSFLEGMQLETEYNYTRMMVRDERRFRAADVDRDLSADRMEFAAFLHPEEHEHMKDVVVQETMEDIDKNRDGFIDVEEYIGDILRPEAGGAGPAGGAEPAWVKLERQEFSELRDQNGDGRMDAGETLDWILHRNQDQDQVQDQEARHLLQEADADRDGRLSRLEVVERHDLFVGSQVTDFGAALLQHDEF